MIKKINLVVMLFFLTLSTYAKEWILSDENLRVSFSDLTLSLTVFDKRCNKTWQQSSLLDGMSLQKANRDKNILVLTLKGKALLTVKIELTSASDLLFSVGGDLQSNVNDFSFPSSFKTPDSGYYLLETDGAGMLLPVTDTEYPLGEGRTFFCGGGLSMAWIGVTDTAFKTGYMAILETPYDAGLQTIRENGLITFKPVWMPSMETLGYERKIRYVFFDKGGYVAQCKRYREWAWKKNHVVTLRENLKKFPAIDKMVGAVQMYLWDNARKVQFAKELKTSGIEKAFIVLNPNHPPYPSPGYVDSIKALGYGSAMYDCYTDAHLRDTAFRPNAIRPEAPFAAGVYPGLYNQITARKKDGTVYSNRFGHYICPLAIRPEIPKRIDKQMAVYNNESYFLDVYQANGLYECYNKDHRLTRQQYAENMLRNMQLVSEKYQTFMGAEWGADYAGSASVYNHGMMTLQRTWFGSEIRNEGTIYYYGNWRNPSRPTQMLSVRVAPDKYLKYSINEYTRVPLYELVYHDAVVSSWRHEDCNHHSPEIWWKKDLFNALYGSAPLWSIDDQRWEAYKQTFVESYKKVCTWVQQVGYDELVSHRFITTDHKVQESVFSSGKRIVVNFNDADYRLGQKTITAKNFIIE